MASTSSYVIRSFSWSVIAKLLDAAIKFVSVPLLLTYFGKEQYGLIALAMSVNAYLQLLDMGVNTGAIKYFSEWISQGRFELLRSVGRTSLTFYGCIGLINAAILVFFAWFGTSWFSLSPDQVDVFRLLILIIALFSILNWTTSVFNQLIIANSEVSFIQRVGIVKSIVNLLLVICTIYFNLSIFLYFVLFTLLNSLVIIPYGIRVKRRGLLSSFMPGKDWINFRLVLKYSSAILLMAIFQMSAVKLRPLILGAFTTEGVGVVSDFRVLESITFFVISMGSMSSTIFLPKTSQLLAENNLSKIRSFAYSGTRFTSVVCAVLCFPFILCANEVLTLYVGADFQALSVWLIIWMITILFFLHNGPVASLVLATGKTRMLVFSTAFGCVISLVLNALLTPSLGVGAAVIGYSVYILIQFLYYYLYFNTKVLNLESLKVFKSFSIPISLGGISAMITYLAGELIVIENYYIQIIVKCSIWFSFFVALVFVAKVFTIAEVRSYLRRK